MLSQVELPARPAIQPVGHDVSISPLSHALGKCHAVPVRGIEGARHIPQDC